MIPFDFYFWFGSAWAITAELTGETVSGSMTLAFVYYHKGVKAVGWCENYTGYAMEKMYTALFCLKLIREYCSLSLITSVSKPIMIVILWVLIRGSWIDLRRYQPPIPMGVFRCRILLLVLEVVRSLETQGTLLLVIRFVSLSRLLLYLISRNKKSPAPVIEGSVAN